MEFPDFILNTPLTRPILHRIFNYDAKKYDLTAYEKISPGAGKKFWELFLKEKFHQEEMERLKNEFRKMHIKRLKEMNFIQRFFYLYYL